MNSDDFEEIELKKDTMCADCKFTVIKGSMAYRNYEEDLIYCSPCLDKLRKEKK